MEFDRFYNSRITFWNVSGSGQYSDDEPKCEEVFCTDADVQPYSGGAAYEEYGIKSEAELRAFFPYSEKVCAGLQCTVGDKVYMTEYVATYDKTWGSVALLRRQHD
ncbi:MAG: hypothetical protein PUF72_02885 [Clostridiales bacterium]|nr:hypothetical protein [Clostridiales bacterium]